jgi:hypothetical protein
MATALFISEQDLKDASIIHENVDMSVLMPVIVKCQDIQIQTALGSELYKDIIAQITGGIFTNANYPDLLNNYIRPALKAWITAELPIHLSYQYTNKGIMQKGSDNSIAPDIYAILKICDRWKNDAQFYTERLTRHLLANVNLFPLYLAFSGNAIERIAPAGSAYNTGMYLGDAYNGDERVPFSEIYQGKNGMLPENL